MDKHQLIRGDCLERLKDLADASVDAVVTDPPYGLSKAPDMAEVLRHWLAGDDYQHKGGGFMGKSWDSFVPGPAVWRECLRVLKPGGHLVSFFGTRTYDMGVLAIRLAGFEIRDQLAWVYGSGFPKSQNVSKAIQKSGSAEGADQWEGWGTALKPAQEPIVLARKPLDGTVAANVTQHGTGAINVDRCRIETNESLNGGACAETGGRSESQSLHGGSGMNQPGKVVGKPFQQPAGRWPANLVHDGSDEVLEAFPEAKGQQGALTGNEPSGKMGAANCYGRMDRRHEAVPRIDASTSAARFFYCAKASRKDRNEGCEHIAERSGDKNPGSFQSAGTKKAANNNHPTVKPTALMRWLVRLVTPPGGVVLDPYTGSGSTGKAAVLEGFRFIGIERDADENGEPLGYIDIATARIEAALAEPEDKEPEHPDLFGDLA